MTESKPSSRDTGVVDLHSCGAVPSSPPGVAHAVSSPDAQAMGIAVIVAPARILRAEVPEVRADYCPSLHLLGLVLVVVVAVDGRCAHPDLHAVGRTLESLGITCTAWHFGAIPLYSTHLDPGP